MFCQQRIKLPCNFCGEGSGFASGHIDMQGNQFSGGNEGVVACALHEMHEVNAAASAPQRTGEDGYFFAQTDFVVITRVAFHCHAAVGILFKIGQAKAKEVEKAEGGFIEDVGVVHDVHVAHAVDVFGDDGVGVSLWEGVGIGGIHSWGLYQLLVVG